MHECWAILPAIAAVTERVRLGSLVAPTSVHHPAILANRAATIDHISNGRLVLGIGAGWQINEHRAYGIELDRPVTRVDRFEEAIQIVRSLLDQPTHHVRRDGTTRSPTRRWSPKPVQSPLPILVGTSEPAHAAHHRPPRRRVEHLGRPRRGGDEHDEARSPRASGSSATRPRCARAPRRS